MTSKKLMTGLFLAGMALDASAAQFVTPPVAMGAPTGYTRQVWCVAQNVGVAAAPVTTAQIFGGNGGLLQAPDTRTIPAGQVAWTAGAAGQGMVWCRFNINNPKVIKGSIQIQDTPVGASAGTGYTTHLVLPAVAN